MFRAYLFAAWVVGVINSILFFIQWNEWQAVIVLDVSILDLWSIYLVACLAID